MRLGIDIDDVIVEFVKNFLIFYGGKKGKEYVIDNMTTYNFWEFLEIPKQEAYDFVGYFYNTEEFENLNLIEGAKEAIILLSENHEILFITSRPIYLKEKTENFLNQHFPDITFDLIHSGDYYNQGQGKGDVCVSQKIDLHIDDHHGHTFDCAEKGVKTFLLEKPWNKNSEDHENILRVKNWGEILENLK